MESRNSRKDASFGLIIQPEDGVAPVIEAIDSAKEQLQILIFRFDRKDVEQALVRAVERGVAVQALIAWTNRGGERNLRHLETRLLAAGVTVSRTASDLSRYHGKMLVVDRKKLYLLAYNFTTLDIEKSRSFGLAIEAEHLVTEAVELFEADVRRQPYKPRKGTLLISPLNARKELASFIERAEKELLIYDPGLGDPQMIRLLEDRKRAGVEVRVIGTMKRSSPLISSLPLAQMRLHTRTIIRDGSEAFTGSQSLRAAELDGRREIGVIVDEKRVVREMAKVFEADWALANEAGPRVEEKIGGDRLAKKVAKAMTRELPPVSEVIQVVAEQLPGKVNLEGLDLDALEESVRNAVKSAVKETIQDAAIREPATP